MRPYALGHFVQLLYIVVFFTIPFERAYLITDCPIRPENWKQLFGRHRCRKSCFLDTDCTARQRCLCDLECGLSCVKKDTVCPVADLKLENGQVHHPKMAYVASTVRYECTEGYRLVGAVTRTCQANRQWSGERPVCAAYDKCTRPPDLPNAAHDAPTHLSLFDLNTVFRYNCVRGYEAHEGGYALAKCLTHKGEAKWFGPDIQCKPIHCGPPGEVLNAISLSDVFTFPNTVTYRCIDGFYMMGSPNLQCDASGRWQGDKPSCQPIRCVKPKSPLYGQVVGTSLNFQSKITYSCDEGHRLVGQKQRVCQSDGSWSGEEPYCEEVRCKTLGVLWNGLIDGDGSSHFGAMVVFRCLEGMSHLGAAYSRCQKDGTWSHPLPACMASCQLPRVTNGQIVTHDADRSVAHGERVHVQCVPYHELEYSESAVCKNGSWSHLPRCVPIRCKEWPESIANGYVQFVKSNHGALAKFHCKPGFVLNGSPSIRCSFGEWKGVRPTCVEHYCPHPKTVIGDIENGSIKLEGSMGTYEYKDYIRRVGEHRTIVFECHHGYLLEGPSRATCVNGTWQPNVRPRCVLQTHPAVVGGRVDWDVIVRDKRHLTFKSVHSLWRNRLTKQRKEQQQSLWGDHGDHSNRLFLQHRVGHSNDASTSPPQLVDDAEASIETDESTINSPSNSQDCAIPTNGASFFVIRNEIVKYGHRVANGTVANMHCSPNHTIRGDGRSTCVDGRWRPAFGLCHAAIVDQRKPDAYDEQFSCSPPADADRAAVIWLPSMETAEDIKQRRIASTSKPALTRYPNATIVKYACAPATTTTITQPYKSQRQAMKTPHYWSVLTSLRDNDQPTSTLSLPSASGSSPHSRRCPKPEIQSPWKLTQLAGVTGALQSTYRHGATANVLCTRNKVSVRIRCIAGRWSSLDNSLCKNTSNDQPVVNLGDCLFDPNDFAHMRVVNELTGDLVIFTQHLAHGVRLQLRCQHLGLYQLVGAKTLSCHNGQWLGAKFAKPFCRPNNSTERPPAILYQLVHGDAAPSPSGELIVRRSSTVHLDCLFPKAARAPHWQHTSSYRHYPQRWVNISVVDMDGLTESLRNLRSSVSAFRLTIYMARPEDSGTYYCVGPAGHRHAIRLVIKDINCPPLPENHALIIKSTKGTHFGSVVDLKCKSGFQLSGAGRFHCLASGRWSKWPMAKCLAVQCPQIVDVDPALIVNVSSYAYGAVATFQCDVGFVVDGPRYVYCAADGRWSEQAPTCAVVKCIAPDTPNGSVVVPRKNNYFYRDIVLFSCRSGYLLTGKNYAVCDRHGLWTNPAPECLRYCWFPGKPVNGETTTEPKSYYLAGDLVIYHCMSSHYVLQGSAALRCTSAGKWSSSVPSCLRRSRAKFIP